MVFTRQYDVARVDLAEEGGHVGRVPSSQPRVEAGFEVIVLEVAAIMLVVPGVRGSIVKLERIQIPFGIRIDAKPVAHIAAFEDFADVSARRRPSRHRVKPPVDEDAELGVVIPIRDLVCAY